MLLVLANFVPLFGAMFWGWSVFEIVMLYWMENLIIGGFSFLRILTVRPPDSIRGQFFRNLPTGIFFAVHYGGFCLVHGVFVLSLLGGEGKSDPEATPDAHSGFLWALLALVVSHGFSFVRNYLLSGAYRETLAHIQMFAPYPRIVVLHLVIIFGAFAIQKFGSPLWMLALLVVGKTVLDLGMHLWAARWRRQQAGIA